jgi:SAM-dependent methyltransferase
MEADLLPRGVFLCPECHSPLEETGNCQVCGFLVAEVDGIPLLVRNRTAVDAAIEAAKSAGRTAWYEAPQAAQWLGPFRHHLRKRRAYVDGVVSAFAKAAARPLTALDIGCGDGMHLAWLHGYAAELYGSDYNVTRLLRARDLNQARCVFMADITNYPARDDFFDVIFFNHVLEHIHDDVAALAEVYRILKPGGLLVLGTPNEGVWFCQLAYWLQPRMLRTSDHVQFYTAETLTKKCRAAGFLVRKVKHIGYGVPHWTLDAGLRQFRVVDDLFEAVGETAFPKQATSLYLSLSK